MQPKWLNHKLFYYLLAFLVAVGSIVGLWKWSKHVKERGKGHPPSILQLNHHMNLILPLAIDNALSPHFTFTIKLKHLWLHVADLIITTRLQRLEYEVARLSPELAQTLKVTLSENHMTEDVAFFLPSGIHKTAIVYLAYSGHVLPLTSKQSVTLEADHYPLAVRVTIVDVDTDKDQIIQRIHLRIQTTNQ